MAEYQVIARKWRPQRFSDVVGQEHVVRTLLNAVRMQRLAHAYLFVGPRGVGKTTLARIFAKAMNCTASQNGEPCCQCESCRSIGEENNLDVIEIDAASRNTAGDMRELAEDVLHRPVAGKHKIYIIDEVHMLSKQAWNALLKTVEEPPAHAKFIFATTEVHQVLPTIISRCQRFDLLPIPTRLIAERLRLIADTEKVAIDNEAINAIARAADGGMRDAQSLLDQMIAFFSAESGTPISGDQVLTLFGLTDRSELDHLLLAIFRNQPGEAVKRIADLARRGKNLETLFDDLLGAVRAVRLAGLLADTGNLISESPERIAAYRRLAQSVRSDTAELLLENLAPVGRQLHEALNKQICLETILLKAMRIAHAVRIDDLLARLNELRSKGELEFLQKIPTAIPEITLPPALPENLPAEKKIPEITDDVPEITEPAPAPLPVSAPVAEPEPASEQVSAPVPAAPPLPAQETAAEPPLEAPKNNGEVTEEITESPVIPPQEELPDERPCEEPVPEMMEEETVCIVDAESLPPPAAPAVPPAPPVEEPPEEEISPDRHSIINAHPEALQEALNDPWIKEAVDLFGGKVVDVHR